MIAKIAVAAANFAIDKPYSYRIPAGMTLQPGMRVKIPFGRGNRPTEGVVLQVEPGSEEKLKAVESCLDEAPVLDETMLHLAAFIRERYFCTFFEAIHAMLPAGLWFQTKNTYTLTEADAWKQASIRQPDAKKLLQCLEDLGGQAQEDALRKVVSEEESFDKAIAYLLRKKWIAGRQDYSRRTSDKTEKIASLLVSAEEAMAYAQSRGRSAAMQKTVLELLCGAGSVAVKELRYFTGASADTVNRLEKLGLILLTERSVLRCREIEPAKLDGPLVLNEEQERAFQGIAHQMEREKPGIGLLYGITGSGKTSVYLKLIRSCLEQGKSAMLLVPEIALTPQLLSLLAAHFGQQVAVLHSSLAAAERYDQWKRVRDGDARVVVGTRSAVFAPCRDLGLMILDEEQEHSYKSENSPRYHAREVAIWRGNKENALVLLGSATPSVESMYRAQTGAYRLYRLQNRYNGRPLPKVEIVDMRRELERGNDLSYSYSLLDAIRETADQGKQTVLFLNRRGNSRAMVCVDCRKAPECPRCSARLTYHSANERVMCHYCGFSQPTPRGCPHCGGTLKRIGVGTQKAQQELQSVYPDLAVDRMDTDTVSAVNTHEKILDHFQQEHIPVLLGTQMVAKGLNLPDVTLVGVLDADLGLYSDSYHAAQTTFQMLTQVVGRAGRGDAPGRAVIQTLVPDHAVIQLAACQDYDKFYELEIRMRQVQQAPPFADVIHITFTGQEETAVLRGAVLFRDSLHSCLKQSDYARPEAVLLGPAPCPVPKINYNFRHRITLRCPPDKRIRQLLAHLLRQFAQDKQNKGVSAFVDVNGFD